MTFSPPEISTNPETTLIISTEVLQPVPEINYSVDLNAMTQQDRHVFKKQLVQHV